MIPRVAKKMKKCDDDKDISFKTSNRSNANTLGSGNHHTRFQLYFTSHINDDKKVRRRTATSVLPATATGVIVLPIMTGSRSYVLLQQRAVA